MAQSQHTNEVEDAVIGVIQPSLQVGVICGGAGFLVGGTAGILRGTTPFLFGVASSIRTFALGTTFWAVRSSILQAWDTGKLVSSDVTKASTLAGGLSGGTVALLSRGHANVLPGAIMFSLFGYVGQQAYNRYSMPREKPEEDFWTRMAREPWSPVTALSNEEYADRLREKQLKIEADISILGDKIAALREQQKDDTGTPVQAAATK